MRKLVAKRRCQLKARNRGPSTRPFDMVLDVETVQVL
jgi:hypothetical protein